MNSIFVSVAAAAAAPSAASALSSSDAGLALVAAAKLLLADLEGGRAIDVHALRAAMVAAFGGSDAEGAWTWKTAYDACEAAQILFLRKFASAMRERAGSSSAFLAMLAKLAALVPSHTRRSEESEALQQFSTPIGLGCVARMAVTDRRTLYVHPQSGAETSVFTITRRDRNRPFSLAEALERANDLRAGLLVNGQSGRAAVQVPAPSLMLDDGAVERRVRLLRPMERTAIPLSDLAHTHWREADRVDFARAWEAEIATVPEFTDSRLHIVTRLLLPIWKRLPNDSMRVYRLQSDAGERIIGRLVTPAWVAQAVDADVPTLGPADAFTAVLDGRTVLQLQDGLKLRRVKVMREFRVELSGFTDGMVERFKAIGLISEIISWKLRVFVPTGAAGPEVLAQLMQRHPLIRVADKAVA